jgi:acetolactate synthase I/II/III large subunit
VLLLVDFDLPYAVGPVAPAANARLIYIDIDPAKKSVPLWNHPAEIVIEAASAVTIPALQKAIEQKITSDLRRQFAERFYEIEKENLKMRREREALAVNSSARNPITADWLSHCLAEVIDEDAIIVNQTITSSSSVVEQIDRTQPGTYLGCAGGSIGWPLGAALGAKLAAPQKTVVSLMGDGAFVWGCPTASLWSARAYNAPFLSIVYNNHSYNAIRGLVQRALSGENLAPDWGFKAGVEFPMPPDYAQIARACGAFGKTVNDPSEVLPALKEALLQVSHGQAAVVDVRLA